MPKVTKSLHDTWAMQRQQFIEERTHDQAGRPRDAESIAEMETAIDHMTHLLSLPIGTTF